MAQPSLSSSSFAEGSISEYSLQPSETNVEIEPNELNVLGNDHHRRGGGTTNGNVQALNNDEQLSIRTSSTQQDDDDDNITDFEEARFFESLVHLRDLLNGNISEGSDNDPDWQDGEESAYTLSTATSSDFSIYTPFDSSDSDATSSTTDEDVPRAEIVAATLEHIQHLLAEAEVNNAMSEAAWANLNNEEPASLITRGFRALIRFPFFVLKTSVMGIWNFNVMLFKIPLIPFYILQKTFYGIATFFAPRLEAAQNDADGGENDNVDSSDNIIIDEGRHSAGSELGFEEENLYEFDRCSTELNGMSEYNESIAGCLDHEPPESDEEGKEEGFTQLQEARPFHNSPFPRRYFSTYAQDLNISDMSNIESFRAFYEPPSQILESPERRDIDEPAPFPLYSLHHRQGRNDFDDL